MTARKRRTPWQIVALEALLAAACALAAYGLAHLAGAPSGPSLVLAGIAAGVTLRLATRHAAPRKRRSPARKTAAAGRRR